MDSGVSIDHDFAIVRYVWELYSFAQEQYANRVEYPVNRGSQELSDAYKVIVNSQDDSQKSKILLPFKQETKKVTGVEY